MENSIKINKIDVIILCGGEGKRLQSVINDRPKPMADINGRPFLDILIDYVSNFGFRRFILSIGYMGDFIKRYYKDTEGSLGIIFSEEKGSLGTAGAIKNAEPFIKSSSFLVMNGDSFCPVDLRKFLKFHLNRKALCSIILTNTPDSDDYDIAVLEESQRIIKFDEKIKNHKNSFVNVGIYLFKKEILSLMPINKKFSLEKDFFPEIVNKQFYGYITQETFMDIGTPERYKKARKLLNI